MLHAESQMNKMIKAKQALTCTELENQADDWKRIVNLVQPRTEQRPQATQYRELSKSVVAILISRKHLDHWHVVPAATGFFISDEGVIATNRHVFNPSDEYMFAMTSDYALHPIQEVLGANRANDLAYCRIDSSDYKGLALSRNTPVGSDISVISHPSGRFYTYSQGVITRRYIRPPKRTSKKENQTEKGQSPPVRFQLADHNQCGIRQGIQRWTSHRSPGQRRWNGNLNEQPSCWQENRHSFPDGIPGLCAGRGTSGLDQPGTVRASRQGLLFSPLPSSTDSRLAPEQFCSTVNADG